MNYVTIGGDQKASAIALGCMRISALDQPALSRHIHTALDAGINSFDHADIYGGGQCESDFGRLLAAEPGLRERMILQSKCGIRPNQYEIGRAHV